LDSEGGPDADNLIIAMRSSLKSAWNKRVANIVLELIHEARAERSAWSSLPEHSDDYFLDIIFDQIERAKTVWSAAQPKVKENGEVEEPTEVEDRMVVNKKLEESRGRRYTRRSNVSCLGHSSGRKC
jgi:rubrerythrin